MISAKPMAMVAMLALAGVAFAQERVDEKRIAGLVNELTNEEYRRSSLDELIGLGMIAKQGVIAQLR